MFRSLIRLLVITCTPSVLFYFTVIPKGVSANSTPMVGTTETETETETETKTEIINTTKEPTTVSTTTTTTTEKPGFWASFFDRITPA